MKEIHPTCSVPLQLFRRVCAYGMEGRFFVRAVHAVHLCALNSCHSVSFFSVAANLSS